MNTCKQVAVLVAVLACTMPLEAASTIQFTSAAYNVAENAGTVALSVRRTDDVDTVVQVDYASADGTAIAGKKYVAVAGTLGFAAGETNKLIVVPILNESFVEGTRTFQVILSNPTGGAVLGLRTNATVRIVDNDTGLQFEFASYSVSEDAGSVLIGVVRGDDGDFPVTVDYAASDETATAGSDYAQTSGTLSFAAEEKVKWFTVAILNDSAKEANKTFHLTLSNPKGGGVLGPQKTATVSIVDNDPGVQFEYSNYWVGENEGSLTVKLFRGSDVAMGSFTVDYATSNQTAIAGRDYAETQGTVTFADGESFQTLTVPILLNESSQLDRQFRLTLSNPSVGRFIGTNKSATITILDSTGMQPHRFDSIAVTPNQSVELSLGGGVHKRFKDDFDLYPVEVSTDLRTWAPLATLQRTNSSTNAFTWFDSNAAKSERLFFRTVTNHLITPFRKPTGKFPVGVVSRLLVDSSRRNRYGISTNGSFMISIWYPAIAESGRLPARLVDPLSVDNARNADPAVQPFRARTHPFVTHAVADAPCDATHPPFPVVLYSPGHQLYRSVLSETGPNLASHGYVVVSVDHFDASATIFPNGTLYYGDVSDARFSGLTDAGFQDRLKDLKLVLAQLAQWHSSDPLFAGRLDLTRVATMGHSWGGGVAAELARVDDRVKAVVLLDAYLQNADDLVRSGLFKPFLGMYSSQVGGDSTFYNHPATVTSVWFIISPSLHAQFSDPFSDFYKMTTLATLNDWREVSRTINAYTLWFLNKYLKEQDVPMPPLRDYPRITGFKQK